MNRLLYSDDCLNVLNDELALPTGSVDLIYLDPPFNSKSVYNLPFAGIDKDTRPVEAFWDTWHWGTEEDALLADLAAGPRTRDLADIVTLAQRLDRGGGLAAYLVNMAARLLPMRRVLADTGSIYLHCDDTAVHYLKLLMDAIFGKQHFRNEIIWERSAGRSDTHSYARIHDTLLYYAKTDDMVWNQQYQPLSQAYIDQMYRHEDERGRYMTTPLRGGGVRGETYTYTWRGVAASDWRFPVESLESLEADGSLHWSTQGNPRKKFYLANSKGVAARDVITTINRASSAGERLGYPTQKPLALLRLIIQASSNPDGLVLDPFCGCGTTIDAAEELGRCWVGVDISAFSVGLMRERILRNFPHLTTDDVLVRGVPVNVAEAQALADRDKFEFEKWVCGAIGAEGMFREPGERGADGGVDGVLRFYPLYMGKVAKLAYAIVQVKGGHVTPDAVKALKATVDRYGATAGVLVCFERFMRTVENQRDRATFSDDLGTYPVIQGLSVERLLRRDPMELPRYGRHDGRQARRGPRQGRRTTPRTAQGALPLEKERAHGGTEARPDGLGDDG